MINTDKTPSELLRTVGYTLYECRNRKELDSFRKYYQRGEELCTFAVNKYLTHHVFFAVKDNALDIRREDFDDPRREDEYSTSVLGIQFSKGLNNHISIKSRYNHTVPNPDSTYFNNLEHIVPGLTKSFEKAYNLNITGTYNESFDLFGYVRANDGLYYRYNLCFNNVYYCTDNIIIDNGYVVKSYQEKEKYILFDYFILDLENKILCLYDDTINDGFLETLDNITKIEVYNDKETETKYIYITELENIIMLAINKYNQLISYHNEYVDKIGNYFLIYNETLKEISLPSVRKIGKYFLCYDRKLKKIYAPNLLEIGDSSLLFSNSMEEMELSKLKDKEFIRKRKKV